MERLPPELFHLILGFLEFEARLLDPTVEADANSIAYILEVAPTTEVVLLLGDDSLENEDRALFYQYPRRDEQRVDHLALRLCSRSVYSLTPRLPQLDYLDEWVSLLQTSYDRVS